MTPTEMWERLTTWLRRDRLEAQVRQEVDAHVELLARDLEHDGLSAEDALAAARRQVGHWSVQREELRDAWGFPSIDSVIQDVRYAMRGLRRQPGFAIGVIATLGLGVGANATMFGIVDRLMLRPPAFLIAPERSHHLYLGRTVNGTERLGQASPYQRYLDLTKATGTMELLAAYAPRTLAIGSGGVAREARVGAASASFWRMFDARPVLGRFFTPGEDTEPNGSRVMVLSYAYWESQYGRSPAVLGSTVTIWPARYTVIGVAPKGFGGVDLAATDAYIPIGMAAVDEFGPEWSTERSMYSTTWLEIYGRRRPGISRELASAELTAAYKRSYVHELELEPQKPPLAVAKPRIELRSVLAERGPSPSPSAKVSTWLLGVAGVVLLVACANVGNLLLTRAFGRRREIAVRIAMGISRSRLARQLMTETLLLGAAGLGVGLLIASWGGDLVRTFLTPNMDWESPVTDQRVLFVAALSAGAAAVIAGLVPILQAGRSDVISTLRAERTGFRRSRIRETLLLSQAMLSVLLLIGAGLFVRSVDRASRVRLGFDADQLVLVQLRMRNASMDSSAQIALRHALLRKATSNPIVEGATLAYSIPLGGTRSGSVFLVSGDSTSRLGEFFEQAASPDFFATMGTRIIRGRGITADDRADSPLVVVISEGMARAIWPTESPIGKCLRRRSPTAPCRTVVGVAENVRLTGLGDASGFVSYYPAAQAGENVGRLFVRVRGEAATHAETLRRELQTVMPPSGYIVVRPMRALVSGARRSLRLGAVLFTVFGALALSLAAIGLYGVIAHVVSQRSHEIGIRIAVGARIRDVILLIVGDGLRVVGVGVTLGAIAALVLGRWIAPLLFDVSPRDPGVFACVAGLVVAIAVAASAVPALRAARVDPASTLRAD